MAWHDDPAWIEALEDFQDLQAEGVRGITLDLKKLEEFFYAPTTFRLIDYAVEAERSADPDGRRYVPRLLMAYFMLALTASAPSDRPEE